MPAFELVSRLISIVLVLSILSLMVQCIQEFAKRFTRSKPRHVGAALAALLTRAGLTSEQTDGLIQQIANGFGRKALVSGWPEAQTISLGEVLLWLKAQPIQKCLKPLHGAKERVEEVVNQSVSGSGATEFAQLQLLVRDFIAKLPQRPEDFTFQAVEQTVEMRTDRVMQHIETLQKLTPPPQGIEHLPSRIIALLDTWGDLSEPAKDIHQYVNDWFDTAIAACQERYEAEMRRWTMGIGFVVAVAFDASFFSIARAAFEQTVPAPISGLRLTSDWAKSDWVGCVVTALLLSAGAPFWQDLLQSLMGIKTRLREAAKSEFSGSLMGR
jgi:hypothetical protein